MPKARIHDGELASPVESLEGYFGRGGTTILRAAFEHSYICFNCLLFPFAARDPATFLNLRSRVVGTPATGEPKVMNWPDLTAIAAMFIVSLGGGGAIVLGLANLIGRTLANKYVEKIKQELQQEIESHKTRLRKSEFLFQKEFDAASTFISLRLRLLPRYKFPDMEWHDACEDFAYRFEDVEKALETYITTHGAALTQETLKRLVSAKTRTSWGKFEVTNGIVSSTAINYAEEVMEVLEEIEKQLYQAVWSQSGT